MLKIRRTVVRHPRSKCEGTRPYGIRGVTRVSAMVLTAVAGSGAPQALAVRHDAVGQPGSAQPVLSRER
jgi:hypothetical protein